MAKVSQSSQMIRVSNELIDLIPELNRLARSGQPIAQLIQQMIDRIDQGEPDEVDSHQTTFDINVDSTPAAAADLSATAPPAADTALLEILHRLEQKIDRALAQPSASAAPAAPAEIVNIQQLIERSGIPFGQLAAAARTSGQGLEKVLEQRTGYRSLGNGNFIKQA